MKINKKICFTIFILISVIITIMAVIPSYSLATDPIANPDDYKPGSIASSDATAVTDKIKPIINAISVAGIVVAVITLIVIGIKYMLGSVDEKAEYKKTMSFYIVGVVFLTSISGILQLINNLVLPLME